VFRRVLALALVSAMGGLLLPRAPAPVVEAGDRDADGRPTTWRLLDRDGRLVAIAQDSNDDGRADIVETIDPEIHQRTRVIQDLDFDGTADVLVLYRDGIAVSRERRTPTAGTRQRPHVVFASLYDPFFATPVCDAGTLAGAGDESVTLTAAADLPAAPGRGARPLGVSRSRCRADLIVAVVVRRPDTPRGPPLVVAL
jgi:hypothetical protein